jgi:hypothetical protein
MKCGCWEVDSLYSVRGRARLGGISQTELRNEEEEMVWTTLVHRTKAVCDPDSFEQELEFLHNICLSDGNSKQQILRVLNPPKRVPPPCTEDPTSVMF